MSWRQWFYLPKSVLVWTAVSGVLAVDFAWWTFVLEKHTSVWYSMVAAAIPFITLAVYGFVILVMDPEHPGPKGRKFKPAPHVAGL